MRFINNKKNKNTVLFLMPYLFFGGSERQVRYIMEGLEQKKIPVIVLIENGTEKDKENSTYIKLHSDIEFVFLNLHTRNSQEKTIVNKTVSVVKILCWIIKNVNRLNIQWIMFTNLTGLITVPFCKILGCSVLFSERNPGIKMCNNAIKRKLLLACDKIVANSLSASQYMSKVLNMKVEYINNGISIPKTVKYNIENNINSKCKIILVPARITPIKNQMVILKAAIHLKGKMDYCIQFVGQVEDKEYNKRLLDYVEEHNLSNEVKFLGYTSSIENYYAAADLIILASYEEGTPNVILEAYLNRKPCLASDIVMNRNVSINTDILFSADNADMLAEKIIWILELKEIEIRKMLTANYEFVRENYNLAKMQHKYLKIFNINK